MACQGKGWTSGLPVSQGDDVHQPMIVSMLAVTQRTLCHCVCPNPPSKLSTKSLLIKMWIPLKPVMCKMVHWYCGLWTTIWSHLITTASLRLAATASLVHVNGTCKKAHIWMLLRNTLREINNALNGKRGPLNHDRSGRWNLADSTYHVGYGEGCLLNHTSLM